eukprot:TRINITY_DN28362_c0_g1_i1.p1 TRINITY_DN28362_c0_g1~~TRINITY_DN28362_c0_g1_i1.p1  ORF type:complete len:388 (+),score=154.36 TRINITY_DN28362_c0_g1_i1:158-1165(+)
MQDTRQKKMAVAVILTLQVTAMVLTLRYSKTSTKYLSSTAVVLAEFLKIFICVAVLTWEHGTNILSHLNEEVVQKPRDMLLLAVPALLYLVQNNLLFFAMDHLDAAVYQVTYQLKILTTAICTVMMLDRRLTTQQWVALVILTAGVALAQMQPASTQKKGDDLSLTTQTNGIIALLVACFTSGFAGVYTEKLLKQTSASLWVRNIQLAVWSVFAGFFGIFSSQDADIVREKGFFSGYTGVVWAVVILQAGSGIVVALVIKVADNIVKNFSVAMSLLLATVISIPLFDFHPTIYFLIGAVLVLVSVHLYSSPQPPAFLLPLYRSAKEATSTESERI